MISHDAICPRSDPRRQGALKIRVTAWRRRFGRAEKTVQVRVARELIDRCRPLSRTILALDRELEAADRADRSGPA
jgi:hypothetical protein